MTPSDVVTQPTWCVNPFLQAHQMMDGQLNPCCRFQGAMGKNINEFINSTELTQLKTELISGIKSNGCRKCWSDESLGIESKRQRDNKTYQSRFQLTYYKKELLEPNPNLAEYYIRLGNNCNLRCAICNDVVSTGWASENKKFGLPYRKKNNIKHDDPCWQHMLDHSQYIKLIEFVGGEPLFINLPLQIEFLEKLIASGDSKSIALRYHTNGTKFNADIANLWKHFKEVTVWISIDGLEKSFEYQRYPAKWNVVVANVQKFQLLSKDSPNIVIKANCTVSVLNVLELDDLLNWFKEHKLPYHLNLLDYPSEYGLFNQESKLKQQIVDYITPITNTDLQKFIGNLLLAKSKTQTQSLKSKLIEMDQKRLLKYTDCLVLTKLLDS
jgi:organic radical activating enzyme